MKDISTLIADIHNLFSQEGTKVSDENLRIFADNVAAATKKSLEDGRQQKEPSLRMSKLGTPDRKLWYELNLPFDEEKLRVDPTLSIKFLYGHILEELILLLVKEAGHTVEGEQGEVEILGVLGHRDCKIDGVTVDVKSASKFAFQKFKDGTLSQDDPFGYMAQISSYMFADKSDRGGFLVINKETGELTLMMVDSMDTINPEDRINHLRNVVLPKPSPPEEKCYAPQPNGKSGNMELNKNCAWCPFKELCWQDSNGGKGLRKFKYATGVKYLTEVVKQPEVDELFINPTN